jgi:hypothetical protein
MKFQGTKIAARMHLRFQTQLYPIGDFVIEVTGETNGKILEQRRLLPVTNPQAEEAFLAISGNLINRPCFYDKLKKIWWIAVV